jgi:hypothetical protein
MTHGPRVTFAAALLVIGAAAFTLRAGSLAPAASASSGDSVATVRLIDSPAAVQLAERTVGALKLDAHMGTAQLADLALDVDFSNTVNSYRAGDVAYWASGEKVVIFLTDGTAVPPEGLIPLGQVTDGLDHLTSCAADCAVHLDTANFSPDGDVG